MEAHGFLGGSDLADRELYVAMAREGGIETALFLCLADGARFRILRGLWGMGFHAATGFSLMTMM